MIRVEMFILHSTDKDGTVLLDRDGNPEYTGYNARVIEHPEVNASASTVSGGVDAMRGHLVNAWNRTFPDDVKTIEDFTFEETENRW